MSITCDSVNVALTLTLVSGNKVAADPCPLVASSLLRIDILNGHFAFRRPGKKRLCGSRELYYIWVLVDVPSAYSPLSPQTMSFATVTQNPGLCGSALARHKHFARRTLIQNEREL